MTINVIVLKQLSKQQCNQLVRLISRRQADNRTPRTILDDTLPGISRRTIQIPKFLDKLPRTLHDEVQRRLVQFVAMPVLFDKAKRRNQHLTVQFAKRLPFKVLLQHLSRLVLIRSQ